MNSKLILLFPDGVGIRNYLYSNVFKGMQAELVLFHAFDVDTEAQVKALTQISESYTIPKYSESVKERFLRELICLARLKHNTKLVKNATILTNWKTNHNGLSKQLFYLLIQVFSIFVTRYSQILWLEKRYQKAIRTCSYYKTVRAQLNEIKPQKVFCSHQRGIQCAPIFAAAQDLGIETITVIYSWDNLPKARMALQADKYLVWSDYMKQELQLYYPEINEEQIFVTGTPQFECYQNPDNITPKEEFYTRYHLDATKKIICYSGDDVKTCPDDPQYLADLADELVKNKLDNDYQILLRRCPVDISGRFDAVVAKYPNLIKQAPPLWNFQPNSSWTTIYPLPEDVNLLVSTAYYCDVVVNLGSTMAFDFAMFQKPCIYINYDQTKKVNPDWSVQTVYQFQHFKSMQNANAVIWWTEKEEISDLIENSKFNKAMTDWTKIILEDYENASERIIKYIKN